MVPVGVALELAGGRDVNVYGELTVEAVFGRAPGSALLLEHVLISLMLAVPLVFALDRRWRARGGDRAPLGRRRLARTQLAASPGTPLAADGVGAGLGGHLAQRISSLPGSDRSAKSSVAGRAQGGESSGRAPEFEASKQAGPDTAVDQVEEHAAAGGR